MNSTNDHLLHSTLPLTRFTRRDFLKLSAATLALSAFAQASQPMNILILGGTGFIGPHQVEAALGRGHRVTIFNRGLSASEVLGVEMLIGDRNSDLSALEGRTWDAVIDNSRSNPDWVRKTTSLLKGSVTQYLYVSSISVYANPSVKGITETGELQPPAPVDADPDNLRHYGGLKVRCEQITQDAFPQSHTIVRPSLIVGPGDPTDRFTYWLSLIHI